MSTLDTLLRGQFFRTAPRIFNSRFQSGQKILKANKFLCVTLVCEDQKHILTQKIDLKLQKFRWRIFACMISLGTVSIKKAVEELTFVRNVKIRRTVQK